MKNSQFEAKTFGVGELISQRKLFRVPPHQRSYAWDKESVEEFLTDIETALANGASDYFIGLVVIQSSPNGEWVLLDGQQRLTTVSLTYAAIRSWLMQSGLDVDAQQIHHDYLGVRRLGGSLSSRMLLNTENQPVFEIAATEAGSEETLKRRVADMSKSGSNKLLLSAALGCRRWLKSFIERDHADEQTSADRIYELARFLDTRLKVVAVEVSSDVDAYVLFESLNDRGVALSALDLIKNFIFSRSPNLTDDWESLISLLGDENPEDFLKVFWTSRYGVIQKSQIFRGVKSNYDNDGDVERLVHEMTEDAYVLAAINDDAHPLWEVFNPEIRDQVYLLRWLDSKQARPLLIAILREISDRDLVSRFIQLIATAIVRFQVIGKGRTGVVEKVFGRLCTLISSRNVTPEVFAATISELLTDDENFADAFERHEDKKYTRLTYLLAADAAHIANPDQRPSAHAVRGIFDGSRAQQVFAQCEHEQRIGNFHLVKKDANDLDLPKLEPELSNLAGPSFIELRSHTLADRATQVWRIETRE